MLALGSGSRHYSSMSAEKRWRLICYDVRDVKRYRKVFKLLRGTGHSVQYSIFRARLDDRQTEKLRWELSRVMAPEDALLIVDLCPHCAGNVVSRNHVDGWTAEPAPFTIIGGDGRAPGLAKAARAQAASGVRKASSEQESIELKSNVKTGKTGADGA